MYVIEDRILDEQPTLVVTRKATVGEIPEFLGEAYTAVDRLVRESGVDFAGNPFARYHPLDPEFKEFEIEAGLPVTARIEGEGIVEASSLPAGPAAATWHIGPYEEMEPAYEAIQAWISEQGGEPEGAAWEVYYSDPNEEPDPAKWRTEIIQPYRQG